MSYQQKYFKYRTKYLELKLKQQGGGVNLLTKSSNSEYSELINKLKKHCQNQVSTVKQLQEVIQDVSNLLTDKQKLELRIPLINKTLTGDNLQKLHKEICQLLLSHIIPYLEKRKKLQELFVQKFQQLKISTTIDIDKFLDYAQDNNMLDYPIKQILSEYRKIPSLSSNLELSKPEQSQQVQTKQPSSQQLSSQQAQTKQELSQQEPSEQSQHSESTEVISIGSDSSSEEKNYPSSKNGRSCTGQCNKYSSQIWGDTYTCPTKPYTTWTGTYDWDYCSPPSLI